MNIIVCIKRIRLETNSRRSIINPLDKNALEEALRLRERFSGKVIALTMGSPPAKRALEEALAIGADEAVFLCDGAFTGADTLATAHTLFYGIRGLDHFDLVLCGNESLTGATGHVGPQLAVLLGVPHITCVKKIEVVDRTRIEVERALEHGHIKLEVKFPAVLSVVKEINHPRLPTVAGIMEAADKEIKIWRAEDIGAESRNIGLEGSPTCTLGQIEKRYERRREIFTGPPEDSVKKAVAKLEELGVI